MAILWFCGVILTLHGAASLWAAEEAPKQSEPFRYDSKGRRDPFLPLVRDGRIVSRMGDSDRASETPILYGILWDPGGKSIALINDGEVKVGDRVNDYEVKEIRPDAVVLSNGGEPVVLQITFEAPPPKLSPRTTKGGGRQ